MESYSDLVNKHTEAVNFLKRIDNELEKDRQTSDTNFFFEIYEQHIKLPNSFSDHANQIKQILKAINAYDIVPKKANHNVKNVTKHKNLKRYYNTHVNRLYQMLFEGSILQNICYLDNDLKLVRKKDPHYAVHTDVVSAEQFTGQNANILKLSVGRLVYEDEFYLLNCLTTYMDNCTLDDLEYTGKITPKLPETNTKNMIRPKKIQKQKLQKKQGIDDETNAIISLFLNENTEKMFGYVILLSDFYSSFKEWCESTYLIVSPTESDLVEYFRNARNNYSDYITTDGEMIMGLYIKNQINNLSVSENRTNEKIKTTVKKLKPPKQNLWGQVMLSLNNSETIIFTLTIKIPISYEENKFATIQSDSQKILHCLCRGSRTNSHIYNMSAEDQIKFNTYYKFQTALRQKIHQLIRSGHDVESFPFRIIDCVRILPKVCGKQNLIRKNQKNASVPIIQGRSLFAIQFGDISKSVFVQTKKKFVCDCGMELCIGGCCRVYHGESDCSFTFDQASEELVKKYANTCTCPKCKAPVEKRDGCNHMTCICKVQFCYVCKNEFTKDDKQKYMISEHYSDNPIGKTIGANCRQW